MKARPSAPRLSSRQLVDTLCALPDRPWFQIQRGHKPLTETGLARRLRSLGISPHNIRINNVQVKGYDLADFTAAFTRFLPDAWAGRNPQSSALNRSGRRHPKRPGGAAR